MALLLSISVMLNLVNNRAGFRNQYYTSDVGKVGSLDAGEGMHKIVGYATVWH